MPTLICPDVLVDGTGSEARRNARVVIKDERIVFVGQRTELDAAYSDRSGWDEIDGAGASLIPGLIDGHAHLTLDKSDDALYPGIDAPREAIVLYTLQAARESLAAGITTLGDCGSIGDSLLYVRDTINQGTTVGPRILAAGPSITTTAGHGHYLGIEELADNADQIKVAIRKLVFRGVDFIKIMATGGASDPPTNRFQAQYSEEEMRVAVEDAHRLRKRVVAHVNPTEGIVNSVRAGVDALAHCNWLGSEEGTVEYIPEIAQEAGRKGIFVDLNVFGTLTPIAKRDGIVSGWEGPGEVQYRFDLMRDMERHGCKTYFSSDHLGRNIANWPQRLVEARHTLEMDPAEVICRATGVAAEGMWLQDEIGTIETGKVADVVLLNGDVADRIEALTDVRAVMRSGRVVVQEGEWTRV
jgi:imidazolonepropionase-like amidohydrolase